VKGWARLVRRPAEGGSVPSNIVSPLTGPTAMIGVRAIAHPTIVPGTARRPVSPLLRAGQGCVSSPRAVYRSNSSCDSTGEAARSSGEWPTAVPNRSIKHATPDRASHENGCLQRTMRHKPRERDCHPHARTVEAVDERTEQSTSQRDRRRAATLPQDRLQRRAGASSATSRTHPPRTGTMHRTHPRASPIHNGFQRPPAEPDDGP
jgi:hypothetical protein